MGVLDNVLRQRAGEKSPTASNTAKLDQLLGRTPAPAAPVSGAPVSSTPEPIVAGGGQRKKLDALLFKPAPKVGVREVAAEVPAASRKVFGRVWDFVKDFIKTPARAPATAYRANEGVATMVAYAGLKATGQNKKADELLREFNKKAGVAKVPGLGNVETVQDPLAAIGVGASIGGYVAPTGPAGSVIMKALQGGSQFGLISGGEALQEKSPTVGKVAGATAGGFATGALLGIVSKVLGKVFKRAPSLPGLVENAGYVAPDVKVKAGSSILSPSVLKSFRQQAAMQVEHEAPGLGKLLEGTSLKGVTTIPQAEARLLKALPKNAPKAARQAVRTWAKTEMRTIGQRLTLQPAEAERAKVFKQELASIKRQAGKNKLLSDMAREAEKSPQDFHVVRNTGGKEVGLFRYEIVKDKAYIDGIAIGPKSQGKGIGKATVDQFFKEHPKVKAIGGLTTKDGREFWKSMGAEFNGSKFHLNRSAAQRALGQIKTTAVTKKAESFAARVKQASDTSPEVAAKLNQTYKPITNEKTFKEARKLIKASGVDSSLSRAKAVSSPTAQSNAESQILIKHLIEKGRTDDAIDLVEHVSKINRESGQAVQALAAYSRLTPQGMLRVAQRTIDDYHRQLARSLKLPLNQLPKNRLLKLTPQFVDKVTERMDVIEKMPEGLAKSVEIAKVLRDVTTLVPSSALQKLATLQTIAQLANPKTIIRNIVGNTGFGVLENVTNPMRVAVDKVTSLITKQRTASFAGFRQQFKAAPENIKIGYLEARHGIKLDDLTTQMDLPRQRVFKKGVLGFFERALDWGLRLPDRIGYGMSAARKKAELEALVKAGKSKLSMQQIAEMSDFYGKYATFQDLSPAATGASKIKQGLNFGQSFGLGDMVLKYPKTPANLLARAIDYSPTGFLKTIFETARPIVGKLVKKDLPFRQAEFVDSFSRAITGSIGLVGTGAALTKAGIITQQKDKDKDVEAFRRLEGVGPYRINADGLWRFIKSGFDTAEAKLRPGDRLFSYDWFQPNAVMMSIGSHMAGNKDKNQTVADTIVNSLSEGVNTIAEQPLVTGIKRLFGSGDPIAGLVKTAIDIPASFIPTVLNQVNQFLDNTQREVYSNHWWQEMMYSMAAKTPIAAQHIPARIDVFGRESARFQPGSNSVFNTFFNPAFLSVYTPTPMTKEILRLYEQTGEKGQVPSLVPKKVKINGTDKELSAQEYQSYQKYMGAWSTKLFLEEMSRADWKNRSDTDRVDRLQKIVSNVRRAGKIKLFGDKPAKIPDDIRAILKRTTPTTPLVSGKRQLSKESEARKGDFVKYLKDYGQALKLEPAKTLSAIFGPERLRKIENDAVILERQIDLGAIDLGDKRSAVDHIVPLAMGGTNSWKNLQILSNEEKSKKDRVEKYLISRLQKGMIKRREAQHRILNWRREYEDLEMKTLFSR